MQAIIYIEFQKASNIPFKILIVNTEYHAWYLIIWQLLCQNLRHGICPARISTNFIYKIYYLLNMRYASNEWFFKIFTYNFWEEIQYKSWSRGQKHFYPCKQVLPRKILQIWTLEGIEGVCTVKWKLGFAHFAGEMGFNSCSGTGIHWPKKQL